MRAASRLHTEDDDFGQAGSLVREVMNDDERERLLKNIVGHVNKVTLPELRDRVVRYWINVDAIPGQKIASRLEPSASNAATIPISSANSEV